MNFKNIRSAAHNFYKSHPCYLLLCMILPAILMYLMYLAKGIHPFGDGCVLVLDLNGQYVWFFEALRNFVKGDADLLYSFSRSLGGEFLGMYAYYLASPLSYLLALFPRDRMLEGLLFLFLLKTAICGGTFGYYMHKTLKEPKPIATVIFSLFYALSAYAVVQQHNTMWIDALMWLPLITLGIEELIKHGQFKRYTIFLALTLLSNFYIGYMVCIYCLLYFFAYYIA
ncbi:MAG: YfhO family protein, partial [Clostridia bacterium]|nr:YfhO family protein [Clostridia bacterium]